MKSMVYSAEVLRMVEHSVGYCALLDPGTTPTWDRSTVEALRRELVLVYTSMLSLPDMDPMQYAGSVEQRVTEEEYDGVRDRAAAVLGEDDVFLDAQQDDMQLSETPIGRSAAELLADLYQLLGDMTWVFRQQMEDYMEQSIAETRYALHTEMGSRLLAVVRHLHHLLSDPGFLYDDDDEWHDGDEVMTTDEL